MQKCLNGLMGNISNDDRIGKFVTLDGDKIKLATKPR